MALRPRFTPRRGFNVPTGQARGTGRGTNTPARQGRQRNVFASISRAYDSERRRAPTLANARSRRRKYYKIGNQWYRNLRNAAGRTRPSPVSSSRVPSQVRRRYGA